MNKPNFEKSPNLSEVSVSYKSKVKASDRTKILTSSDTVKELRNVFDADKIDHSEEFVILLLNRANHVLGWAKISQGGLSGTVVDVRIIFQIALGANASKVILAHNHPSGNMKPSEQDRNITKQIKEAGKLLEIEVLDHVILTSDNYLSFADEGLL